MRRGDAILIALVLVLVYIVLATIAGAPLPRTPPR